MTDQANANQEQDTIEAPKAQPEQAPQEKTQPNGKDLEANAESGSNDELNGSSEADQESNDASPETSGQDEDKEQDTERRETKRRARDRIQQLVAQKRQAEAEAQSYKAQLEKITSKLEPPGEDATQEEIDRYNFRQVMREERAAEISSEAETRVAEAHASRQALFEAKAQAAADRMPGLLDKFYSVKCSDAAADFITESDKTAELANYLGSNPVEAARIHTLPAIRQVAELARLEARLSAAPTAKKATTAPKPPPTISGASSHGQKRPDQMTEAEYIAWRRKSERA